MKFLKKAIAAGVIGATLTAATAIPASAERESYGSIWCGSSKTVVLKVTGVGSSSSSMRAAWKVGGVWKYKYWGNTNYATRYALTGYHNVQDSYVYAPALDESNSNFYCQY